MLSPSEILTMFGVPDWLKKKKQQSVVTEPKAGKWLPKFDGSLTVKQLQQVVDACKQLQEAEDRVLRTEFRNWIGSFSKNKELHPQLLNTESDDPSGAWCWVGRFDWNWKTVDKEFQLDVNNTNEYYEQLWSKIFGKYDEMIQSIAATAKGWELVDPSQVFADLNAEEIHRRTIGDKWKPTVFVYKLQNKVVAWGGLVYDHKFRDNMIMMNLTCSNMKELITPMRHHTQEELTVEDYKETIATLSMISSVITTHGLDDGLRSILKSEGVLSTHVDLGVDAKTIVTSIEGIIATIKRKLHERRERKMAERARQARDREMDNLMRNNYGLYVWNVDMVDSGVEEQLLNGGWDKISKTTLLIIPSKTVKNIISEFEKLLAFFERVGRGKEIREMEWEEFEKWTKEETKKLRSSLVPSPGGCPGISDNGWAQKTTLAKAGYRSVDDLRAAFVAYINILDRADGESSGFGEGWGKYEDFTDEFRDSDNFTFFWEYIACAPYELVMQHCAWLSNLFLKGITDLFPQLPNEGAAQESISEKDYSTTIATLCVISSTITEHGLDDGLRELLKSDEKLVSAVNLDGDANSVVGEINALTLTVQESMEGWLSDKWNGKPKDPQARILWEMEAELCKKFRELTITLTKPGQFFHEDIAGAICRHIGKTNYGDLEFENMWEDPNTYRTYKAQYEEVFAEKVAAYKQTWKYITRLLIDFIRDIRAIEEFASSVAIELIPEVIQRQLVRFKQRAVLSEEILGMQSNKFTYLILDMDYMKTGKHTKGFDRYVNDEKDPAKVGMLSSRDWNHMTWHY